MLRQAQLWLPGLLHTRAQEGQEEASERGRDGHAEPGEHPRAGVQLLYGEPGAGAESHGDQTHCEDTGEVAQQVLFRADYIDSRENGLSLKL